MFSCTHAALVLMSCISSALSCTYLFSACFLQLPLFFLALPLFYLFPIGLYQYLSDLLSVLYAPLESHSSGLRPSEWPALTSAYLFSTLYHLGTLGTSLYLPCTL